MTRTDPARADQMLGNLIMYLRQSMPPSANCRAPRISRAPATACRCRPSSSAPTRGASAPASTRCW
ncbi:MAG: hypothetical protein ACXWVG_14895 [Telluria sp.]